MVRWLYLELDATTLFIGSDRLTHFAFPSKAPGMSIVKYPYPQAHELKMEIPSLNLRVAMKNFLVALLNLQAGDEESTCYSEGFKCSTYPSTHQQIPRFMKRIDDMIVFP